MSKIKKYVLLFAGLVIAFTGFTSCKSDALEEIDFDSNEQEETLGKAIKAQFTISIPMSTGKATRQSGDIVQSDPNITNFRGINEIKLYPSALKSTEFLGTTADNSKFIGRNIALSELMIPYVETITANSIPKQKLTKESNSVLYGDVQLQIGTRSFLFYGAAIAKDKLANFELDDYQPADKVVNGHLTITGLTDENADVSQFEFSPTPIIDATDEDAVTARTTKQTAICNYLKKIAESQATVGGSVVKWSEVTETANKGLKELFDDFTGKKSASAYYTMAGSSKSLEAAVEDLYFSLINNSHELAQAICNNIYTGTTDENVEVTNTDTKKELKFKESGALYGFPSITDNLPDGAAVITWNGTVPSYAATGESGQYVSTGMNISNLSTFAYPACLYYWGKSDILTSEDSKKDLFDGTNNWATIATEDNYKNGDAITSKTRSVVLTAPVNYAVGRLDISVVYPSTQTQFEDNGKDKKSWVNVGDIKLTGIIIGGQKPVDWQFLQKKGTTDNPVTEYTIYDDITKSTANTSGLPVVVGDDDNKKAYVNHTLVLESAGKVGDVEDKVNVALEFVNNGPDFYGIHGIIPKGTKFYLVGSLDAGNAAEIANNSNNTSSYNNTEGKVFKQDYVTYAQFTIAKLKSAYNTIPDLRNPAVELGLSVDLTWQDGITFKHTFE